MIVFSPPGTGKTEAIANLNIDGFEIDYFRVRERFVRKDFDWIAEFVYQVAEMERDTVLMSAYLDDETMGRIFWNVDNDHIILCGYGTDYVGTVLESSHCRYLKEIQHDRNGSVSKEKAILGSWADPHVIERNFDRFKRWRRIFDECTFLELQPGQYLTEVLEPCLQDYRDAKRTPYFKIKRKYPSVI